MCVRGGGGGKLIFFFIFSSCLHPILFFAPKGLCWSGMKASDKPSCRLLQIGFFVTYKLI